MSRKRISMKKIREVLRLRYEANLSQKKIAISVSVGEGTVWRYLDRAKKANLVWPLPKEMNDIELENLLFPPLERNPEEAIPLPDFEKVHKELKRKGVTLHLLWEEYLEQHTNGYKYSRFCILYKEWADTRDLWMPQQHKAGEKIFIDYAGLTMPITLANGQVHKAQIFIGTLGASNFTYVEATMTQNLSDWTGSHVRMFSYFGGVSELLVPDNLKAGVTACHRYDPEMNHTYLKLAEHYQCAIMPARVRAPKDKSKVEKAVKDIETQILARLRNHIFFSLEELNKAIRELLEDFNNRSFQKIKGCRRSLYEEIEKACLKPLPSNQYSFAEWQKKRVGKNYHVEVQSHYYSAPHSLVGKKVDVRISEKVIEVFYKNERHASHIRNNDNSGKYTTIHAHRPPRHRHHAECTPEYLMKKAEEIGDNTKKLIQKILNDPSIHQSQRERSCLGIVRLVKSYQKNRLDQACKRGLEVGISSCKRLESMLKAGLEQVESQNSEAKKLPQSHEFLRGPSYYQ